MGDRARRVAAGLSCVFGAVSPNWQAGGKRLLLAPVTNACRSSHAQAADHRPAHRRAPGADPRLHPRYWNAKRVAGYVNWHRNRRELLLREVLDRLVADMRHQAPDHVAVTGDLVNVGLPAEHMHALTWLQHLGAADAVSVIPGNHDIYGTMRLRSRYSAMGRLHDVGREGAAIAEAAQAFRMCACSAAVWHWWASIGRPYAADDGLGRGRRPRSAIESAGCWIDSGGGVVPAGDDPSSAAAGPGADRTRIA